MAGGQRDDQIALSLRSCENVGNENNTDVRLPCQLGDGRRDPIGAVDRNDVERER
jgi:hypothetical protein